jgi:hypothetical protein
MWIPLINTIYLLFFTAVIFYILPKYPIKWQIIITLIWLCGVGYLASTTVQNTNMSPVNIFVEV